jgi:hypothetical protein
LERNSKGPCGAENDSASTVQTTRMLERKILFMETKTNFLETKILCLVTASKFLETKKFVFGNRNKFSGHNLF